MDKIDRRVKRTHKLLQDALVDLALEKGYELVTIRDITERADVGYATFFRHYSDKDALLADVLDAMKKDILALLIPNSFLSSPETNSTVLFQYVQQNRELCRVLFDTTRTMSLVKPVQEIGMDDVLQLFEASNDSPIPVRIAANHLVMSLVMLIQWWLDNDMPYSPEEMGRFAAQLIIRPVTRAIFGDLIPTPGAEFPSPESPLVE